jgi:hypothetical protein
MKEISWLVRIVATIADDRPEPTNKEIEALIEDALGLVDKKATPGDEHVSVRAERLDK